MKTNSRTKILLLLLTFAMVATMLSACKKQDGPPDTEDPSKDPTVTQGETDPIEVVPDFEPTDYDAEICILQNDYSNSSILREEWDSENAENENLEYALIDKVAYLEEKYGVTFEFRKRTKVDVYTTLANEIMTNEGTYDIIDFPLLQTSILASQGLLYNLSNIENIDLSKPWWNHQLNDDISYNGNNFFAVGNSNLTSMWTASCVFFNKDIAENYGKDISAIYQMVDDRTWTLEKMLEMAAEADDGNNINGVSQTAGGWYTAFYGSGMKLASFDDNLGEFVLNPFDELLIDRITDIIDYKSDERISLINDGTLDEWKAFTDGNALFLVESISVSTRARASSVEYGILPSPLGAEGQASYFTSIHPGHSSCFSVPVDVWEGDLPMLAVIMEEANYISRKLVWPEMYDTLLKGQVARDPQSAEILDIIFENLTVDPCLMYAPSLDQVVRNLIASGNSTNVKSTLDGAIPKAEGELEKVNTSYREKAR